VSRLINELQQAHRQNVDYVRSSTSDYVNRELRNRNASVHSEHLVSEHWRRGPSLYDWPWSSSTKLGFNSNWNRTCTESTEAVPNFDSAMYVTYSHGRNDIKLDANER